MYQGERFNSISHLVGAVLALIGTAVLVSLAGVHGEATRIVSFSVYGLTLFLLYLLSTLYHSLPYQLKALLYRKLEDALSGSYLDIPVQSGNAIDFEL